MTNSATPPTITNVTNVIKPAAQPKTLGTLKATPKEKPHTTETDAEKKARKDRIRARRKLSKT